ncbi:MAG: hypothetical protein RJA70_2684, partial [Pseudomonadota bacterium]
LRFEQGKTWLEVTLKEGKNRQIHRIGEAVGTMVLRLARVAFAGLNAEGLRPGQWRYLSKDELVRLKKEHGVPNRIHPAPPLPNQKEIRKDRASGKAKGRAVVTGKPGVRSSNPARTGRSGRMDTPREDEVRGGESPEFTPRGKNSRRARVNPRMNASREDGVRGESPEFTPRGKNSRGTRANPRSAGAEEARTQVTTRGGSPRRATAKAAAPRTATKAAAPRTATKAAAVVKGESAKGAKPAPGVKRSKYVK